VAAVQAPVITFAYKSNTTNMEIAINAFFFTGLFLDIVGGCMAYVVAVQLQHIYALLLRRLTSISQITNSLDQYTSSSAEDSPSKSKAVANLPSVSLHLRLLEVMFLHAMSNRSWESVLPKMRASQRSVDQIIGLLDIQLHSRTNVHLQEYQRTTEELHISRAAVNMAISAIAALRIIVLIGVSCFVVGGLCYVKHAQPAGVWITTFTVLGGILISFVVMMWHATSRS
jgi:hypothetical protein